MSRAAWLGLVPAVVALVLLRLPSLVEPSWYPDEGTYADIGRALAHGAVLYRDVWDNKPPAMYWLTTALTLRGVSVPVLHAVLAALGAVGTLAVFILGRRLGGGRVAVMASLTYALLASLPNFDGDLLNAEVVGAVLVLLAMTLMLRETAPRPQVAVLAGTMVAAAVLVKAVFVVDLIAVAAVPWLLASANGGRPGTREVRSAAGVVAGSAILLGGAALALAFGGSLRGLVDVLTHADVDYLRWSNDLAGAHTRVALALLTVSRLAIPVISGLAAALWLVRRGRSGPAVLALWLGCDLSAAMVSARGLTHYIQQAEPALVLVAAMAAAAILRRQRRAGPFVAAAILVLTWPVAEFALWLPRAEVAWAQHQPAPSWEHHNFGVRELPAYYQHGWQRLTGRISADAYAATFPADMQRQRAVVDLFQRCSRAGQPVFVWGTVHWAYALSDRVPAGRYPSLGSAYYIDKANEQRLLADLTAHPPAVLVVDAPPPPALWDMLHHRNYAVISHGVDGEDYWLAPWVDHSCAQS
ncbi:MAG: hypothetical protein E6J14_02570 [Chloroflexi bacterium]|nr:MAG: hypothetical protein E6J14_02570 [Chloroflexota bacterium]